MTVLKTNALDNDATQRPTTNIVRNRGRSRTSASGSDLSVGILDSKRCWVSIFINNFFVFISGRVGPKKSVPRHSIIQERNHPSKKCFRVAAVDIILSLVSNYTLA
jgi:hypothetical protein